MSVSPTGKAHMVSNNYVVRPNPAANRELHGSIPSAYLSNFRIGILSLSIRQLSTSDGMGLYLALLQKHRSHSCAAVSFKRAW